MWLYNEKEVDGSQILGYNNFVPVGFVYRITNLTNDRKYIGKKLLKFTRTKTIKGKKKKVLIDSDWKTYFGSSNTLTKDVETLGESNFKREILVFCQSRGECNYLEALFQFQERVLERDDYYNDQIRCRIYRSHVKKKEKPIEKAYSRSSVSVCIN